jgi:hypothetical protein
MFDLRKNLKVLVLVLAVLAGVAVVAGIALTKKPAPEQSAPTNAK